MMMRNLFLKWTLALVCFFYVANPVFPQEETAKILIDPKVRYGKLENGMTYYIRHNELPTERADFYIVHHVGSMQEEESQRGLAHFLEHMAFNGTKNFPAKTGIKDYTESIGMRMGQNMNAFTSFDETVYMLMNAPVTKEGVTDSCLLILHDWSSCLLLEDETIEKERGVIREEWRTRRTAQSRMWEQQLPKMYPGSKYGQRLPIGDIDVINNFKAEELREYYKKWYRPDLQAIIIVGDIDVDQIEAKIKTMFSDIPAANTPHLKEKSVIADNPTPLVSIAKDKEMTNTILSIYYKHDKLPDLLKGTIADFMTLYTRSVISMIMSERFSEMVQKPDPPFIAAYANDGDYFVSKSKGAWTSIAIVKDNDLKRAMNTLVSETERVKEFGFTEAEYERAKTNILKAYESAYNEREKQQNSSYAQEYIRHFTEKEPIPGIETEYEIMKELASTFSVEGVNTYARNLFNKGNSEYNVVISLTGPDKEELVYPSEEELLNMFRAAQKEVITAYEEEIISKELIPELPAPGKIVSEKEDPLFGATLYTLSNGVRVVIKPTDHKEDEILMTATSPGGTSLFKDDKDIWNLKVINNAVMLGGLGDFKATHLRKALAGKNVSCSVGLGASDENVNGSASPSDLKTLFELIYLEFTAIRIDDEAYASFEERVKAQLKNQQLNPMIAFSDTLTNTMYRNNPRNARMKASDFEKINYHRMIEMYNERYADASDFLFTFVGNIEKDSIRPLLEQYLATLPSLGREEKADENQVTPFVKGKIKRHFSRKLETPKSTIGLMYTGHMPYNLKNAITSQFLKNILDLVYTEKVREEQSASYGVGTAVSLYDFPEGRMSIQIFFDTDPEKQDKILNIVKEELEHLAKKGPKEEHLSKTRKNMMKSRTEDMQENSYWLQLLDTYYYRNYDFHTDYEETLNAITTDDIRLFTKTFLDQGNAVEVVMSPFADTTAKE